MDFRVGGYAKLRGKTKGFRRLPLNRGDYAPANMVALGLDSLLFLAESKVRSERDADDPKVKVHYTMWKVLVGELILWVSEEVLREPRRDEVPEEAWAICGI